MKYWAVIFTWANRGIAKLNSDLPHLRNEYKANSVTGKWLKRFFGLAFLNPAEIYNTFFELLHDVPNVAAMEFADYLFANYVAEYALFPPQMWMALPSLDRTTTNGPEAFHSDFNKQFHHVNPSVGLIVLQVLREIQSENEVKIREFRRMDIDPL